MRLCAFFQLLSVNALIFACERAQILLLVTGKQQASSQAVNLMINFAIVLPASCLAIWYPKVGSVAAICGAFVTMFTIYVLPVSTNIAQKHQEIDNYSLACAIRGEDVSNHNQAEI